MAGKFEEDSSLSVVLQQCNDLIAVQNGLIAKLKQQLKKINKNEQNISNELNTERLHHKETKSLLYKEQERCLLIESENTIIKKQLGLEKQTFEKAFGILNNKSFRHDGTNTEELITRITGLQVLCEQRKNELDKRDRQMKSLQMKLVTMTTSHKREIEELEKQLKQKVYHMNTRGKR